MKDLRELLDTKLITMIVPKEANRLVRSLLTTIFLFAFLVLSELNHRTFAFLGWGLV